jgi:mono/diheme cytochrome c family protein
MKPTAYGPAARLTVTLGLVAGAWLIPLASTAGVESFSPAGDAPAAAGPERIHLAQAGTVPVERPISYASDQADRGEERYKRDCEECHGDDLKGGLNGGPPLRGLAFEQKYGEGLPASVMFVFMSSTMPPNAPGRYSPSTYADLMAYILKRNGFREGAPLPSDFDALDSLIVDK